MLTSYVANPTPNNRRHVGYKTFVFGHPAPEVCNRWLSSAQGPGFHVFARRASAAAYAAGVPFSVVKRVYYRRVLSYGFEGSQPAVTAEMLYIPA